MLEDFDKVSRPAEKPALRVLSIQGHIFEDIVTSLEHWLVSWNLPWSCLFIGTIMVFSPLIDGGGTHFPVFVVRTLVLVVATGWILHRMKKGSFILSHSSLLLIVGLFIAWAVVSILWSPYKSASAQWLVSLLIYALFLGVVLQGVRSNRQGYALMRIMLIMGCLEGIVGIVQYFWLGEARARGTFFNANFFALYEAAVLALALGIISFATPNALQRMEKLLLWGTTIITMCAFFVAQSRGALLACAVIISFIGVARLGKAGIGLLVVFLLAASLIPNPLQQRIVDIGSKDPYAYTRLDIWKNSFSRIAEQPFGIGLGMYKYGSFQSRFPIENNIVRFEKRAESAHSEYLQIAVELGLGGLALFLVGIGVWGIEARQLLQKSLEPMERGMAIGCIGAVIGILTQSTVDSVFHEPALMLLLIMSGGIVLALHSYKLSSQLSSWVVPLRFHPIGAMLVIVCSLVLELCVVQPAAAWFAHLEGAKAAREGRSDQAMQWFRRASFIEPGATAHHDDVAQAALQLYYGSANQDWLLEAISEESLAMELNPLDGRLPYRLGTLYSTLSLHVQSAAHRARLIDQAVEAHRRAIEVEPVSPLNYFEIGKIQVSQGSSGEAESSLRKAIAYEPNFLPARVLLTEVLLKKGDLMGAKSEYDTMIAIKKRYEGRILNATEHRYLAVNLKPLAQTFELKPQ